MGKPKTLINHLGISKEVIALSNTRQDGGIHCEVATKLRWSDGAFQALLTCTTKLGTVFRSILGIC